MKLLVLAVAVIGITSCSRPAASETPPTASEPPAAAVVQATVQNLSSDLNLTAEFVPYQEVDVMAKVAGYVKEIYVDVGDHVRQGQTLAILEIPELNDELAKAKAAVELASAEVARERDEIRRAESVHQIAHLSYERVTGVIKERPGLVAQQEIDDAHSKDLVAEAQVASANSSLAAAQQKVSVNQ